MYKVEPEALASGFHGFSEITHLVLCECAFWGGKGDTTFIGFSELCGPRKLNTVCECTDTFNP